MFKVKFIVKEVLQTEKVIHVLQNLAKPTIPQIIQSTHFERF